MFNSSNYEKLLSEFVLKMATYSYNKKVKEYNPNHNIPSDDLAEVQTAALALKTELLQLPPGAQSKMLLQRIDEILKTGN